MFWGRHLQGGVGSAFGEKTGRSVEAAPPFTIYLHPEYQFVGATLDFFQNDKDKGTGILETKCTGDDWEEAGEPPVMYQVQAQVQLAVAPVLPPSSNPSEILSAILSSKMPMLGERPTFVTLCAFRGLRRPPAWADLERNDKFVKRTLSKLEEFRWRIVNRKPPEVHDGLESTSEALRVLYPKDAGEVIALPAEAQTWAEEVDVLKAQEKEIKEQIALRQNQAKALMGTAAYGVLVDGSAFSWTWTTREAYTVAPGEVRTFRHVKGLPKGKR